VVRCEEMRGDARRCEEMPELLGYGVKRLAWQCGRGLETMPGSQAKWRQSDRIDRYCIRTC